MHNRNAKGLSGFGATKAALSLAGVLLLAALGILVRELLTEGRSAAAPTSPTTLQSHAAAATGDSHGTKTSDWPFTNPAPTVRSIPSGPGAKPTLPPSLAAPSNPAADVTAQAAAERKEWIAGLHQSGPSEEPWTQDARRVISSLRDQLGSLDLHFGQVSCWKRGCEVEVSYPDMRAYWTAREKAADTLALAYPDGPKVVTGPESQPNNEVFSHMIFIRPEGL
jgi:hypothetical protein